MRPENDRVMFRRLKKMARKLLLAQLAENVRRVARFKKDLARAGALSRLAA
jgi:hypothetical protein